MSSSFTEQKEIREYLLGRVTDEAVLERIELRLMADDEFADEFGIAEHDLIEQYLDGELTGEERKCFDEHFILPKERQETMRLVEDLRDHAASQPLEFAPSEGNGWNFAAMFRTLRFASVAIIVGLAGLGVWRFAIYESDTDKGLAQMQKAYKGQRLIEPRITSLPEYSPFVVTRGADTKLSNVAARDMAELYLLEAAQKSNDARAHQALSLLNFAERKYDRALQEIDLALAASPRDTRILNDAGAIYLELGKRADDGKKYEYLDKALKNLDLAISIDPKMTEPRFNRALCLMELAIPERAREAWQEYLEIDSNSKWADEARRHLETIDKQQPKEISTAELETQFIAASNAVDEIVAAQLIAGNRELIRDKYLPQRLAASYVNSPESRRDEFRKALQYAGEIEFKKAGDAFAKDIAFFYLSVESDKFTALSEAHVEIRSGYAKCLNQQFGDAIDTFKAAEKKFELAGDEWNAALAKYFLGYALTNADRSQESFMILTNIQNYAQQNRYLWLDASVSHWIGNVNQKLQRHTDAKVNYVRALEIAEKIDDGYAIQRNLVELARLSAFVGQNGSALNYLSKMFNELDRQNNSERQRYRNYSTAVEMLSRLKLLNVAKELSLESVILADSLGHNIWKSESRGNIGAIMIELDDYQNARNIIEQARFAAANVEDAVTQRKLLGSVAAKTAELDAKLGNFDSSAASFREAVSLYSLAEVPFYHEDANKGLLSSLTLVGQADEVKNQIDAALKIAESYRSQIRDKDEQRRYFDLRTSIYEMACDFELKNGDHSAAYELAESSRSRTLLDSYGTEQSGRPLKLSEIQSSLPKNSQILQYTVLPKHMAIWLITNDKFVHQRVEIDAASLRSEIDKFLGSIRDRESVNELKGQNFLYEKLIKPIHNELDQRKELVIVPHKMLFSIPFAAIASSDSNLLINEFVITYSPSASVYIRASQIADKKSRSDGEAFLGIGNPKFNKSDFDGLPDLSAASGEVTSSAAGYRSKQLFIGEKATASNFLKEISRYDVVHFGGHYVTTPGDPMSSFMLFADDGGGAESCKLTNRELATRQLLRTKLIVLAACQTGVESISEDSDVSGLTDMFLAANVPLVVASIWNVDSAATAKLMNRFHNLRSLQSLPTAQALRLAQVEMLNDDSEPFAAPYYWAGISVFGGYAGY